MRRARSAGAVGCGFGVSGQSLANEAAVMPPTVAARVTVVTMNDASGSAATLTIGDVARHAGVSVDAVRYYERLGLVRPAGRTAAGYRVFGQAEAQRVADVKTLQSVGMSLDEVAEVVAAAGDAPVGCAHSSPVFTTAIERLNSRIDELVERRDRALAQADRCDSGECGRARTGNPLDPGADSRL